MGMLKTADFYYGAFLSAMLNYGELRPMLIDNSENQSRKIYEFITDNTKKESHVIYTKYVTGEKKDNFNHWRFYFSPDEVKKIIQLQNKYKNVQLSLICVVENLKDSEVVIVEYKDALELMGVDEQKQSYRINIKTFYKKNGFFAYGSGRKEKLKVNKTNVDNYFKISRDAIAKL